MAVLGQVENLPPLQTLPPRSTQKDSPANGTASSIARLMSGS